MEVALGVEVAVSQCLPHLLKGLLRSLCPRCRLYNLQQRREEEMEEEMAVAVEVVVEVVAAVAVVEPDHPLLKRCKWQHK
jgi:hypothetical protein